MRLENYNLHKFENKKKNCVYFSFKKLGYGDASLLATFESTEEAPLQAARRAIHRQHSISWNPVSFDDEGIDGSLTVWSFGVPVQNMIPIQNAWKQCRVVFVHKRSSRADEPVLSWVVENGHRLSCSFAVDHCTVLHTSVLVVAQNLWCQKSSRFFHYWACNYGILMEANLYYKDDKEKKK